MDEVIRELQNLVMNIQHDISWIKKKIEFIMGVITDPRDPGETGWGLKEPRENKPNKKQGERPADSIPVVSQEIVENHTITPKEKVIQKVKKQVIHELFGRLTAHTEKALCIKLEHHQEIWFPRSQITNRKYINEDSNKVQAFNFTEWILKKKGVIE